MITVQLRKTSELCCRHSGGPPQVRGGAGTPLLTRWTSSRTMAGSGGKGKGEAILEVGDVVRNVLPITQPTRLIEPRPRVRERFLVQNTGMASHWVDCRPLTAERYTAVIRAARPYAERLVPFWMEAAALVGVLVMFVGVMVAVTVPGFIAPVALGLYAVAGVGVLTLVGCMAFLTRGQGRGRRGSV